MNEVLKILSQLDIDELKKAEEKLKEKTEEELALLNQEDIKHPKALGLFLEKLREYCEPIVASATDGDKLTEYFLDVFCAIEKIDPTAFSQESLDKINLIYSMLEVTSNHLGKSGHHLSTLINLFGLIKRHQDHEKDANGAEMTMEKLRNGQIQNHIDHIMSALKKNILQDVCREILELGVFLKNNFPDKTIEDIKKDFPDLALPPSLDGMKAIREAMLEIHSNNNLNDEQDRSAIKVMEEGMALFDAMIGKEKIDDKLKSVPLTEKAKSDAKDSIYYSLPSVANPRKMKKLRDDEIEAHINGITSALETNNLQYFCQNLMEFGVFLKNNFPDNATLEDIQKEMPNLKLSSLPNADNMKAIKEAMINMLSNNNLKDPEDILAIQAMQKSMDLFEAITDTAEKKLAEKKAEAAVAEEAIRCFLPSEVKISNKANSFIKAMKKDCNECKTDLKKMILETAPKSLLKKYKGKAINELINDIVGLKIEGKYPDKLIVDARAYQAVDTLLSTLDPSNEPDPVIRLKNYKKVFESADVHNALTTSHSESRVMKFFRQAKNYLVNFFTPASAGYIKKNSPLMSTHQKFHQKTENAIDDSSSVIAHQRLRR